MSAEPPQEIWYYPNMAREYSRFDTTAESTSVKITHDEVEAATLQGLISENGVLSAGVPPHLDVATADGEKNMAASLAAGTVTKIKKAPKEKEAVEVTPQTWKEPGPYFHELLQASAEEGRRGDANYLERER